MSTIPVILTIAGSDCSGGAGIQADIKTISALKGYAASVITAVTAQNTMGVQAVCPIPPDIVRAQITSVMDDLRPAAIKIGMVHNAAIVHTVAECLQNIRSRFVVYDPVMVSTSGRKLMTEDTVRTIQEELFPLCSLITPNLGEASLLLSNPVTDIEKMKLAACELANRYHCAVLVRAVTYPAIQCAMYCTTTAVSACSDSKNREPQPSRYGMHAFFRHRCLCRPRQRT